MPLSTPNFALSTDGVQVFLAPPEPVAFANVSTSRGGIVGTGSWGPLNAPLPFNTDAGLYDQFGRMTSHANSLVLAGLMALDQGNDFVAVRVDDGTSVAAQFQILDATPVTPGVCVILTGLYTGDRANLALMFVAKAATWTAAQPRYRFTIQMPDANPETWDDLAAFTVAANGAITLSVAALWTNVVNAVNNGTTARQKSRYFTAAVGSSVAAVNTGTFGVTTLGTNGTAGVTTAMLVGVNGNPKTGLWALAGQGCDTVIIAGGVGNDVMYGAASTALTLFEQQQYAYALGITGLSGTSTDTAQTTMQANGMGDTGFSPAIDFVQIIDPNTGQLRMIDPLGHLLGAIVAQPPEASPLNKPANGFSTIIATEKTLAQGLVDGEAAKRAKLGLLYITPSLPGSGGRFKMAHGQNSSQTPGQDGVNYKRLSNYLVKGLFALCWPYVGLLQTELPDDDVIKSLEDTLNTWLEDLRGLGRIKTYHVDVFTGNTAATVAAGVRYVTVKVVYKGTIRFIAATLQGGVTVKLASASTASAALTAVRAA